MGTTFEQLHNLVSPHLRAYRDDLEKHDRKTLEEHDAPFIYGYRRTGTNILSMWRKSILEYFPDMKHKEIFGQWYTLKDVDAAREVLHKELIWITHDSANRDFLYYDGKKLRKSTKEEVSAIWTKYVNNLK